MTVKCVRFEGLVVAGPFGSLSAKNATHYDKEHFFTWNRTERTRGNDRRKTAVWFSICVVVFWSAADNTRNVWLSCIFLCPKSQDRWHLELGCLFYRNCHSFCAFLDGARRLKKSNGCLTSTNCMESSRGARLEWNDSFDSHSKMTNLKRINSILHPPIVNKGHNKKKTDDNSCFVSWKMPRFTHHLNGWETPF